MKLRVNQIVFFGLVFHLCAAIFSIGHHHADELFQIFEFGGYKLHLNAIDELPWEFAAQMRSGIQPLMVYAFTLFSHQIGIQNPFYIAMMLRVLQTCFSFWATYRLLNIWQKQNNPRHSQIALWFFAFLFWCMPYFHARFSSENFATALFVLGLSFILDQKYALRKGMWLIAGLLFGLSFCIRFQMSFFLLGVGAWLFFVHRAGFKFIFSLFFGFLVSLFVGFLCDHWLYDGNVLSWWNYLSQNVFQNKAGQFGTSPFYFYVSEGLLQLIPPFSLIIVWAMCRFFVRRYTHVLTFICVPFILLHTIVPHKELRFLFPLLYFLPFFMATFIHETLNSGNKLAKLFKSKVFLRAALAVNFLALLIFTFKPADDESLVYKKIYALVEDRPVTLLYEHRNPYNAQAGLHYFRHPKLSCEELQKGTALNPSNDVYLFQDGFKKENLVVVQSKVFVKVYSNFPVWIKHFDFNGWLQRANAFSIYRLYQ